MDDLLLLGLSATHARVVTVATPRALPRGEEEKARQAAKDLSIVYTHPRHGSTLRDARAAVPRDRGGDARAPRDAHRTAGRPPRQTNPARPARADDARARPTRPERRSGGGPPGLRTSPGAAVQRVPRRVRRGTRNQAPLLVRAGGARGRRVASHRPVAERRTGFQLHPRVPPGERPAPHQSHRRPHAQPVGVDQGGEPRGAGVTGRGGVLLLRGVPRRRIVRQLRQLDRVRRARGSD